ncbi:hypothetical protein ACOAKC_05615 [Hathewaya histolytica]|uniref:hypothetical protein n=1 Tax=Hathewaya histolytica TaxID=1498 RepID=UPI003B6710DD
MDCKSDKILFHIDTVKKIKSILEEIKILSQDKPVMDKLEEINCILENNNIVHNENSSKDEEEKLLDLIYNKMKSTKDKDLNVKLYMLYRKLEDEKISNEEARELYEVYIKTEYNDRYI